MRSPEMTKRLTADGSEPAEPTSPEQFRAYVAREYEEVEAAENAEAVLNHLVRIFTKQFHALGIDSRQ
jgi:hypothetical protein